MLPFFCRTGGYPGKDGRDTGKDRYEHEGSGFFVMMVESGFCIPDRSLIVPGKIFFPEGDCFRSEFRAGGPAGFPDNEEPVIG